MKVRIDTSPRTEEESTGPLPAAEIVVASLFLDLCYITQLGFSLNFFFSSPTASLGVVHC